MRFCFRFSLNLILKITVPAESKKNAAVFFGGAAVRFGRSVER